MIMTTINIVLGVLVALSVWCAAVTFAILTLRIVLTVYHLMDA